jgi:hypothetical protein
MHEQTCLAGDFLLCDALGSESLRKASHLRSPEMVRLFTVKPQKRLGAAFNVSGAPIGGELQQRHVLSVLSGESPKNCNTLAASPSQRLNGCCHLFPGVEPNDERRRHPNMDGAAFSNLPFRWKPR